MLSQCDRATRRSVFAIEDKARRSGNWGPWRRRDVSHVPTGTGWMRDVHTVHQTDWLVVMIRSAATPWGPVEHAIIRTARNAELGWIEKQRIKDEIFGRHRTAVEVMPPAERVVDQADVYHLWVLPEGMSLPFGLHKLDQETRHGEG